MMLTYVKYLHKIEAIQKRTLRFMLNGYESSYEDLLKKAENQVWIWGELDHHAWKFTKTLII